MSPSNAKRELRRSRARRDRLANEIAFLCSEGRMPCSELLVDWSIASIRYDRLNESLRPRECGSALGEGQTNGTHIPAVEVSPGTATQGNAAPTPAPFPNNNTQPERNAQ